MPHNQTSRRHSVLGRRYFSPPPLSLTTRADNAAQRERLNQRLDEMYSPEVRAIVAQNPQIERVMSGLEARLLARLVELLSIAYEDEDAAQSNIAP